MDIKDKVFTALSKATKPLRAGEVADITGIDKKEVEKAIKQLVKEEKVYSPIRCCYQIK
jgi:predicted transcriptional regulator